MNKPRSQQIFEHALRFATPFSTSHGHPWAIIPDGPTRYHGCPVHSRRFREWLAYSFHHELEIFPGAEAMRAALDLLSAYAHHSEFPVTDVFTRLGWRGSRSNPTAVLLNLGNPAQEIVEITPAGHRILTAQSWRFLAGASTAALPRPVHSTSTLTGQLEPLLGIRGAALERIAVWLFAALKPCGPYPVLWLTGPPSSGKSTIARILRNILDPTATPLIHPPLSPHELYSLALHNRVLAFDHVSTLPRRVSSGIARLSAGTCLPLRGPGILDSPLPLSLERPIIITAPKRIEAFNAPALEVALDPIPAASIRPVAAIDCALDQASPAIIGTLCSAVSMALSGFTTVQNSPASRIPDAHRWALAAAPLLGLTTEAINRAVAADPLIDRIHALLEPAGEWTGTATALLQALQIGGTPSHLSERLARAPLALFGLQFLAWKSHRSRRIRLAHAPALSVREAAVGTVSPIF